jgi:two-component system, LuxR family, response regulator FixJ
MNACMESAIERLSSIFIIDDDRSFGKSLVRLLNASGFSSHYFESAQSFFSSILPDQHGCILVDIHMPECDGFCMIDKLHELHYDMKIIAITGCAQSDAAEMVFKKGVLGLLEKPFSEKSLLELLKKTRC